MLVIISQQFSGAEEIEKVVKELGVKMADPEVISKISEEVLEEVNKENAPTMAKLDVRFRSRVKSALEGVEGYYDKNQLLTHKLFYKHIDSPKYIFVYRNLLDITEELWEQDDEKNIGDVLIQVNEQNNLINSLLGLIKEDKILVSYDKYLKDPDKVKDAIKQFINE